MTESISHSSQSHFLQEIETHGIIHQIGNTPLLEIDRKLYPEVSSKVRIFAKAEWFNPGGSVKDRAAWAMINQAIQDGALTPDKTIIDASSGNTGIALAMIGSAIGIDVTICIPSNASQERLRLLTAYGANIVKTDPLEGTDGAIIMAREIVNDNPELYCYTDQYNNNANWQAHYETTAVELIQQTKRNITHFVTGLGTSGTFTGITRRLKEDLRHIQCVAIQPDSPFHGLEGLKHMNSAIRPGIYDEQLPDANITVSTKAAQKLTFELARKHGLLVGISSGANLAGAIQIAETIEEGNIVTIFCDRGDRYLAEQIWGGNL